MLREELIEVSPKVPKQTLNSIRLILPEENKKLRSTWQQNLRLQNGEFLPRTLFCFFSMHFDEVYWAPPGQRVRLEPWASPILLKRLKKSGHFLISKMLQQKVFTKILKCCNKRRSWQKQRISSMDSLGQKMSCAFINCNYKAINKHKVGNWCQQVVLRPWITIRKNLTFLRLPARKLREKLREWWLLENEQCKKVILPQDSNL